MHMLFLFKPSPERIRTFLASQTGRPFSYTEVGATAGAAPTGYAVDRVYVRLGTGRPTYDAACAALRRWQQFQLGWTTIQPPDAPLQVGQTVAVLARGLGFWSLHACRVVYLIEQPVSAEGRSPVAKPLPRFGFAYGTLAGQILSGEERFLIEHAADDAVWYEIFSFARPQNLLGHLGYSCLRHIQKRFKRQSGEAMQQAV
jgi:uncharacterized protein (UPF0548 family)